VSRSGHSIREESARLQRFLQWDPPSASLRPDPLCNWEGEALYGRQRWTV